MVTTCICTVLVMLVVGTQALGYYGGPPPLTPVAFPLMPATPFGGFGGGFGGGFAPRQQPQVPEILTCIAKDMSDPNSQIRLTVSGSRGVRGGGFSGGFGGFGGFDDDDFDDFDDDFEGGFFGGIGGVGGSRGDDRSREYRVDGTLIPSISIDKSGTYQVVVTTYGRTADGCSADALGPVFHKQSIGGNAGFGSAFGGMGPGMGFGGGFGGIGGFGGFGGMGMGMGMSPFMGPYSPNMYNGGGFWNQGGGVGMQQQAAPLGQLPNPAIVGGSATIYSAHVNRVSKNELLGRGMALCPRVTNGMCEGYIPYCCTITRDSLPAMELFVQRGGADPDDGGFGLSSFAVGNAGAANLQGGIGLAGAGANNLNAGAALGAGPAGLF